MPSRHNRASNGAGPIVTNVNGMPPSSSTRGGLPQSNLPTQSPVRLRPNQSAPSPLSQVHDNNSSSDTLAPPKKKKEVHMSPDVHDDGDEAPCFIHSQLDKHGSVASWLRHSEQAGLHRILPSPKTNEQPQPDTQAPRPAPRPVRPQTIKPLTPAYPTQPQPDNDNGSRAKSPVSPPMSDSDGASVTPYQRFECSAVIDRDMIDSDDESSSLTRQLAATAQGVREVSKQLGRTTVRSRIQSVLIVTKARDNRLIKLTRELALYLMLQEPSMGHGSAASSTTDLSRMSRDPSPGRGIVVYVDSQLRTSKRFDAAGLERDYPRLFEPIQRKRSMSSTASASASTTSLHAMAGENIERKMPEGQLRYWTPDMCSNSPHLFEFVITLGGDGTVLFTSWLFQKIVPPVLPFALGSLGFLTNFNFDEYKQTIDRCLSDGIRVNLRMRFTCTVYRAIAPDDAFTVSNGRKRKAIRRPGGEILVQQVDRDGWEALEGNSPSSATSADGRDKEIMCFTTRPVEQFEVLNDLVVDRGPSPYVSLLELFGDEHHLTTVQADGLTVATPTGSTAYSLSAGGSLVHPQIPAILITPICPHTLSFRPMLLPDSMELRICVPYNSRSTAWASFDGRGRVELKQGDHIKITASRYPFPTVCADKQSTDWFQAVSRTLRWNEREKQKSFVVVEENEDANAVRGQPKPLHPLEKADGGAKHHSSDEYSDASEEFDIDDKSSGANTPPNVPNVPTVTTSSTGPGIAPSRFRRLVEQGNVKSGVQSPDRFASPYDCPPPISQRHLLEKLAKVEKQMARANITSSGNDADGEDDDPNDRVGNLPSADPDSTLQAGEYWSRPRYATSEGSDARTPRQGRSRSRSRHRGASKLDRSVSPAVSKSKAFAFIGHDESASELSEMSE